MESPLVTPTPESWAFVLNQIVIEADLPFELAPDCFIKKASDEQRERITEALIKRVGGYSVINPRQLYECEAIFEKDPIGSSCRYEPLPESDWRYYIVVTNPDNGITLNNLNYASNISDVPLELLGLYFPHNDYAGWNSAVLLNHFQPTVKYPSKKVDQDSLADISEIYKSLIKTTGGLTGKTDFPEILRAIEMFDSLRLLPANSEFHVLGLFAIIEMLITHNPKLEDRGDSITHQMQSKIPLLSRRFDRQLDFSSFFGNTTEKKIWAALYKYRSALAHGGVPDFHHKDLRILKNADNAKAFLKEVVKALLRHSLQEPQLYRDLRDC